jgi:P-type E1-E2 ATPase
VSSAQARETARIEKFGVRGAPRQELAWLVEQRAQILAAIAVVSLVVGGLLYAIGEGPTARMVWRATVALMAAELAVEVGHTVFVDHSLRPDPQSIVERLRAEGVRHVAMLSGDRRSVAERVGRELGVDRVYAEQSPKDKLEVVRGVRAEPAWRPVIMVGDGVNDAPALALADLGIAMGAAGATVSSQMRALRG